jgi:hypothetical protein
MSWLKSLFTEECDPYWNEIEAALDEMRKRQKQHRIEIQEALMRQKVAELSSEMEWWGFTEKRKLNGHKHHHA